MSRAFAGTEIVEGHKDPAPGRVPLGLAASDGSWKVVGEVAPGEPRPGLGEAHHRTRRQGAGIGELDRHGDDGPLAEGRRLRNIDKDLDDPHAPIISCAVYFVQA